ncbi:hypothetical protein ACPCG0_14345 [Propionibacteriaceae bacterium Y1923]|uniref:hypothetical protein n=1 Tax=Aestuariimicrobium sp. Y1814 TaxID=3418742 RepID=UPI003C17D991
MEARTMGRHLMVVCAAVAVLLGCTATPAEDDFMSLRDLAVEANKFDWGCDVDAAPDDAATKASVDTEGYATITCGTDGRLTVWASDAIRVEMSRRAPFSFGPPLCEVRADNWTARGSIEQTRALRKQLGIQVEHCSIE